MKIKAKYENKVLKPLEDLKLKEGEIVEVEIKKRVSEKTFGLLELDHKEIEEIIESTEYEQIE